MEVEASDHPATTHEAAFEIAVVARVGDVVLTAGQPVEMVRTDSADRRRTTVRPFLDFSLRQVGGSASRFYSGGEVVNFTALVRHSTASLAEAEPAWLRVITDHFTGYDPQRNSVAANYTVGGGPVATFANETARQGSFFDIKFPTGVMFPDVIEV